MPLDNAGRPTDAMVPGTGINDYKPVCDMGMMGPMDNGVTDLDNNFWDGMEIDMDFEATELGRPFSLSGLLFDSYAK